MTNSRLLAALAVLTVLPVLVQSCGMVTHSLVAHRASTYFWTPTYPAYRGIVDTYIDSVMGGAPFPDYLYTCGMDALLVLRTVMGFIMLMLTNPT